MEENKSADEIFHKLGYGIRYKGNSKNTSIEWLILENDHTEIRAGSHGVIFFNGKTMCDPFIEFEMLQAINEKVKELGW